MIGIGNNIQTRRNPTIARKYNIKEKQNERSKKDSTNAV